MDKKLEARIARLEKYFSRKSVKNESANAELESMSNDVRDYLADNSNYFSYDNDVKITSYEFIISTDNEITRRDFNAINQLKSDLENYLRSIGYDFDRVSFDIDPHDKYGIIVTIK